MTWNKILMLASTLSGAIPGLFAIAYYRQVYTKNQPYIVLLLITALVEIVAISLASKRMNNMWLYSTFTVVEFALLTASLQRMQYQKIPVIITGILILLVTAATLIDVTFISKLQQYNSFSRIIACLLMIGMSLFGFYDLIKNHVKESVHLTASPLFWLALAILMYMAGNLFVFALTNILAANNDPAHNKAWVIHSTLNFVYNIMLVNVVLCLKKAPSYTT